MSVMKNNYDQSASNILQIKLDKVFMGLNQSNITYVQLTKNNLRVAHFVFFDSILVPLSNLHTIENQI